MTGARSCGCSFAGSRHGMGLQPVGAWKKCVSGADGAAGVLGGRSERCQRFLLAGWPVSDDIMTGCTLDTAHGARALLANAEDINSRLGSIYVALTEHVWDH